MTRLLFLFISFFICILCHAQKDSLPIADPEKLIYYLEYNASFPGGSDSMKRYVHRNFIIPDSLLDNPDLKISGRIIAEFTIQKDGTVSEIKIVQGLHPALDNEYLSILRQMPKWKPAYQNGYKVIDRRRLAITVQIPAD